MRTAIAFGARLALPVALLFTSATSPAQTIIDVIDIRPIAAQGGGGNVAGLAYIPGEGALFIAVGTVIYTLDLNGNVLALFDLASAQPGHLVESFAYDETTGHLFMAASFYRTPDADPPEWRLLELDPPDFTVLTNVPFDFLVGLDHTEEAGVWGASFAEDVLRLYTRSGTPIEELSVASSFPGAAGPIDLADSPSGGFLVLDFYNRRIVEIDRDGVELNATSVADLGTGGPLQIESDIENERVFLQVNNDDIFVLSAESFATPTQIAIDLKPRAYPNIVNPRSHGRVAAAILTTGPSDDLGPFDATTVDPSTVRLGVTSSTAAPVKYTFADVDGDGDADMLLHFQTQETGMSCDATSVALTAETYDDKHVRGTDAFTPVGCR